MRGLIPLVLFGLLIAAFAAGLSKDPSALPSEMIDRRAPEFTLPSLYEDTPDISDDIFTGNITLLNIFGSWCTACVAEHPLLMSLAERSDIQLIGVDWRDSRASGQAWLKKHGNPYSEVIFDEGSLLAIDLGITGAPETFLIDQQGRIRYKHVGVMTPAVWRKGFTPRILLLLQDYTPKPRAQAAAPLREGDE